jgi:N-acetylglucosaminyldiphosphoundecaprenol N-acetyl-beta-D-mannosaminyltransferase
MTAPITPQDFQTARLFGLDILAEPFATWWPRFCQLLQRTEKPVTLFTPNPEILVTAYREVGFHSILKKADVLIPDGIGLVWASKWLAESGTTATPERIAGVDVVKALLDFAASQHWSVLVIGGREYVKSSAPAAARLNQLSGEVYWLSGFHSVQTPTLAETTLLQTELQRLKPAIVLVAFGAPAQERWIIQALPELTKARVKLSMSVGGSFDVLLGTVARAPRLLQVIGLEWAYRLLRQPWRWRRQLNLLEFIKLTAAEKKHSRS